MRKEELATEEFYHIFNRGVDKREVFLCEKDYSRFLTGMREFNREDAIGSLYEKSFRDKRGEILGTKSPIGDLVPKISNATKEIEKLVEIICYCLNPNHYHLILRQLKKNGISKFMLKIGTGYTTYFNKKYDRSGSLFQGPFKSVHIDSNEQLLYVSAYVNANHFIHGYETKETKSPIGDLVSQPWPYSSLPDYLGKRNGTLAKKEAVFGQFKDVKEYAKFIEDNALYLKEKKEMEKYVLE